MLALSPSTLSGPSNAIASNPRPHDDRNVGAIEASLRGSSQAKSVVAQVRMRRVVKKMVTAGTLLFCWALFGAIGIAQNTWLVSPTPSHPTIQETIDNFANNGDTIELHPGLYVESINFNHRAITIKSLTGASTTIIDPGLTTGSLPLPVVSFDHGEGADSVLQDITIRGGSADGLGNIHGGGIRIVNDSSPTIDGCIIELNGLMFNTPKGGGIYIKGGAPIIRHCTISNNTATAEGAGIYCEDSMAIIQDNGGMLVGTQQPGAISGNTAGSAGGGIYVKGDSAVTIHNNRIGANTVAFGSGGGVAIEGTMTTASLTFNQIESNTVAAPSPLQGGGGIACLSNAPGVIQIMHNEIVANQADGDGGGIHCHSSSPIIGNNTITLNIADGYGGGINLYDNSSPQITATTINGNIAYLSGGGMSIRENSNARVRGGDIGTNRARLYGGGVYIADSSPIIGSARLTNNGLFHPGYGTFTQRGGGIAILTESAAPEAPTITGCTFKANFAEHQGAGIYMNTGTATISRNTISGNGSAVDSLGAPIYTANGGGIWAGQGSPTIDGNYIIANEVGPSGFGVGAGVSLDSLAAPAPAFTNNIIVQNWAHQGMGGGVSAVGLGGYQFVNNTIADNYNGASPSVPLLTNQGNALYHSGSTLDLWNCIVRGDVNTYPIFPVALGVTVHTCNIGPVSITGTPGSGDPSPQFVNPAAGNYHLLLGSPCIDMGSITPLGGLSLKDFDNQVRPNPNPTPPGVDIGADEYY